MTILNTDITFKQSERMTDFDDGGGQMSTVVIQDGVLDSVFPDASNLDGILGRTNLRKVYLHISSANSDAFLGARVYITDPAADPRVSLAMFVTNSFTDERVDAATYVQNYRIQGVKTQFVLYGLHIVGQQTLQFYCRDQTVVSPSIGDVLELSIEGAGLTPQKQLIAVDKVLSRLTLTFEDSQGTFTKDVLQLQITQPLRIEFAGVEDPVRGIATPDTVIRSTQVSSSSNYYGISPLAVLATTGDLVVKVASPFTPIVPSSQSTTPLTDVLASIGTTALVQSGDTSGLSISTTGAASAGVSITRYFSTPYTKGSLLITIGSTTLSDDKNGNVASTTLGDTSWSGTADYINGAFTIAHNAGWSSTITATATPAGAVVQQSYSAKIPINSTNRNQTSYVEQLPNLPAVGTTLIDYRSLAKWTRLSDQGNGQITGNPGEGSASENYATGSIALTVGYYPDVDTDIVFAWGTDLRTRDVHGEITIPTPTYKQQLGHGGNVPGTCSINWLSATVAKTASVSSAGVISGDAAGTWDMTNGIPYFTTPFPPDSVFTFAYQWVDPSKQHVETFHPTATGNEVSFTLAHASQPYSVVAKWSVLPSIISATYAGTQDYIARDDGAGSWVGSAPGTNTLDYSGGAATVAVTETRNWTVPTYTYVAAPTVGTESYISGFATTSLSSTFPAGSPIVVTYLEAGATPTTASESFTPGPISINLGNGATGPSVPGSVRFTFRGRTYVDRNGSLYYGIDPTTNAGTFGGSWDYAANTATLTDYGSGSNTVVINSLLTRYAATGVSNTYFRTPGAPLKPGQFTWRCADLQGNAYTGGADIDGNITGTGAKGLVTWDSGSVSMLFGSFVTAAGNEGQPWYNVANVVGSTVWKPILIDPSTLFIGCVVFSSIPLDPGILGLDPVGLPADGRVQWIKKGNVAAVHNTQTLSLTPTAGLVTDLGRTRLEFAEIKDSATTPVDIDGAWFVTDLDAGTVTWANPLNLSAYTMPVNIRHRITDEAVVTDVQITGEVTLQSQLTHDFPLDGTYVSSCALIGDMQARVSNVFDQQTWTVGEFSDELVGAPAGGTYNNVLFPIVVTNDATRDQRWAAWFQSTNTVSIIGETFGNIGTFSILSDIAPINPATITMANPGGTPYFTIPHGGWGSGWTAGNAEFFKTPPAIFPAWLGRCRTQGPITVPNDAYRMQLNGNAR